MQSPVRGKSGKEKTLKLVFLENGAFEQHEHGVEYSGEQQGKKRDATYHIIPPDFPFLPCTLVCGLAPVSRARWPGAF